MENIVTCNPLTTNSAISPFAWDHAFAMSVGVDRTRVVPTSAHVVDSYRPTNAAALAKQGVPPRGEPR